MSIFEQPRKLILFPIGCMLLAVLPLPYEYYPFLRTLMLGTFAILLFREYNEKQKMNGWAWIWACGIVLFNPIIPFQFPKLTWALFNIAGAALMWVYSEKRLSKR